ncbi:NAD-dependent epimerase/dehydratase family protein [Candidatus Pelagibacter sp.]|jgi:UDP-glucose 4-epimerase|nr:NAD-dependent epimerase/dehydratase family protein [Candidatus Pelagibacter sp.]|tara:strand:+ start:19 stop:909 length:891 start_codon:yes stop_codon:yes gene_type:complete
MNKLIVTGAAGFIAPHIIEEALNLNWEVTAVDRIDVENKIDHPKLTYLKMDVNNLTDDHLKGVDFIAHLAFITNIPYCIQNPIETTDENINTSVKLLALATKNKIKKFIYPSTASLYGHNEIPWVENMNIEPIEPYSWHKHSVEKLCKMWNTRYNLKTSVLRLYQVYGENQRKDTALAAFIRAKKTGKAITLTETTAQSTFRTGRRDFIYVKDVAKAFIATMLSDKTGNGEMINIGTGIMTTMEDIAKTIGGKVEFIPKRNFEVEAHQADMSLCNKLLDWKPTVKVLDWLSEFVKN